MSLIGEFEEMLTVNHTAFLAFYHGQTNPLICGARMTVGYPVEIQNPPFNPETEDFNSLSSIFKLSSFW